MTHYPMTNDQGQALKEDLKAVMDTLSNALALLRACYGDNEPVGRAEEASAAVQRLVWAVERKTNAEPCGQAEAHQTYQELAIG